MPFDASDKRQGLGRRQYFPGKSLPGGKLTWGYVQRCGKIFFTFFYIYIAISSIVSNNVCNFQSTVVVEGVFKW